VHDSKDGIEQPSTRPPGALRLHTRVGHRAGDASVEATGRMPSPPRRCLRKAPRQAARSFPGALRRVRRKYRSTTAPRSAPVT